MTFYYSANGRGTGSARVYNPKRARGILRWACSAGLIACASIAIAQNAPQITSVDPTSGKVNDTVVVSGSNLGKDSVVSVYLSDDKNDYKTTIVEQTNDKITVKVPQVKAGDYNVSIETGGKLFIKPIKFKVQE